MEFGLCCTKCGELLVKSMPDGSHKVRSKILVFKEEGTFAVCKGCNTDIKVPITLDTDEVVTLEKSKKVKLYLKK